MAKKVISVSGLKVKDILKMTPNDFRNVSTANVKEITSRLVSAMNKRIKRLGASDIGRLSPTYRAYESRGKYSVRNLTRESTIQVFQNLKESFGKATSLTEWKKERIQTLEQLDLGFLKEDTNTEKKFWDLYRSLEESDKRIPNIKGMSGEVINIMKKKFLQSSKTGKEPSVRAIKNRITRAYNKMMQEKRIANRGRSTSSYFEDDGN